MTVRIEATRLIPGRGDVVDDAVVVLDDTITYAGPVSDAPETKDADVVKTETVMPGMWDCHGHFTGIYEANIDAIVANRPQVTTARSVGDAMNVLQAGFTSIREVGGVGIFIGVAIAEGQIPGPNIYGSAATLSMTAGHGDLHGMPLHMAREAFERHWGEDGIVDGPDEARAGVRRMLRAGARVIKIHASGGVMSQIDDPHLPQFSKAELEAIVDEATRMEVLVAAHTHGKRGMMAAIEAGVKTLEHGTYLDEEVADAMVENGVILVPTRFIVEFLVAEGEKRGIPEYAKRKIAVTAENHQNSISMAVDKGVKIAMGTDIFASGLWGRNAEELGHLVGCGMTPLQAIETATANGPATLGPQAPNSGQLKSGMDADVICVSGDPSSDVSVLADPSNVTHVFKGGVRYKG
ncbi:MAG TPA: amidohydrolase family protein [Acidimicrobiia bacterium]|nr:amidohydrolase family protein [Acidimicrobiia bacterium]